MEPGLEATSVYDPPNFSWPSGAHVAVVEVDTETGAVDLVRYVAIDDVGNVINPMIVDGQVHGGLAQGIAQALWEEAVYDEDGNLLTGSLVELHRADRGRAALVRARPRRARRARRTRSASRASARPARSRRTAGGHERGRSTRSTPLRRDRRRHAGDARASLERDHGRRDVIPAAFDYEVAESLEHAFELLGHGGRQAARGRPLAAPAHAAALRAAVAPRRRRPPLASSATSARTATGSRSAR